MAEGEVEKEVGLHPWLWLYSEITWEALWYVLVASVVSDSVLISIGGRNLRLPLHF